MVKAELIQRRISKLEEFIQYLLQIQQYDYKSFMKKPEIFGSAERFLHMAIESLIDMGNHVIADMNLGEVGYYSDIPLILMNKGYLNEDQKNNFIKLIGFRNTLVHEYIDIDRKIVYDILKNHLEDIKDLEKVFAQFL